MSLELITRFDGNHGMTEYECPDPECDGRMLMDRYDSRLPHIECPMPTCDEEVEIA